MIFGLKAALWYAEAGRNLERLRRAREAVRVGKLSGAVGTFAHVDPDVEEEACRAPRARARPVSTQIVQRDRHAEFSTTLADRRRIAREGRPRDPLAPAHGDPGGGGAVHGRAEGLERHAPQAQSRLLRAGVRARPARAHQCAGRARERRPVARAGRRNPTGTPRQRDGSPSRRASTVTATRPTPNGGKTSHPGRGGSRITSRRAARS